MRKIGERYYIEGDKLIDGVKRAVEAFAKYKAEHPALMKEPGVTRGK